MKFLISQLSVFITERHARKNLGALLRYLAFLIAVITAFSVLFHFIMFYVEGQRHSWVTGFYWTLTVMSTLGFGDITFQSDIGRVFSIVVLVSGIVLLLIMLPFTFIRYFYAPWLEAQIRLHAPRAVPEETKDHVILCNYDSIAPGLIQKLEFNLVPYFVLEPDPVKAARMATDEISVVTGQYDSRVTFENLRVSRARMIFVNCEDTTNTNITLTVREVDHDVPIMALAEDEESIDILEMSGATHVLPLKQRLGEQLAARARAGSAHIVGAFRDLRIAEFVARETALAGKSLKQTRLRQLTGVSVVAVWERGRLQPVHPDLRLSESAVMVVAGSEAQIGHLNRRFGLAGAPARPVLVIGGGKVGQAVAGALVKQNAVVHVLDKDKTLRRLFPEQVHFVAGDAAHQYVLREAGLEEAATVVLTTSDDAENIYLAVYCRRLRPDLNIVTRITHERNIEAIYRAGADSVLSYSSLGREYVVSMLMGREPIMVGEGADFFLVPVPKSLVGKSLAESQIGSLTGLIVIAVEHAGQTVTNPPPSQPLPAGGRLWLLGTAEQRRAFAAKFD